VLWKGQRASTGQRRGQAQRLLRAWYKADKIAAAKKKKKKKKKKEPLNETTAQKRQEARKAWRGMYFRLLPFLFFSCIHIVFSSTPFFVYNRLVLLQYPVLPHVRSVRLSLVQLQDPIFLFQV
jgi:hypothetical protein